MFPNAYFGARMFAPRYFPKVGLSVETPLIREPTRARLASSGRTGATVAVPGSSVVQLVTDGRTEVEVTS